MSAWTTPQQAGGELLDPYFRWALATDWRGMTHWDGLSAKPVDDEAAEPPSDQSSSGQSASPRRRVRLLVKGNPKDVAKIKLERAVEIPSPYMAAGRNYFTATLDFTAGNVAWMKANSFGTHWKLAMPLRDAETRARANRIGYFGPEREASSLRPPAGIKGLPAPKAEGQSNEGLLKEAIAVIDFGCPFLNQRFTRKPTLSRNPHHQPADAGTRIHAFWDQGAEPIPSLTDVWRSPQGFGYGREIRAGTIDAIRQKVWGLNPEFDEQEAYQRIGHLVAYDDARRRVWRATHGAHVLDLAGGSLDPLGDEEQSSADAAGQAELIFVQLPSLTAADASGASLGAHVLDALHYVLAQCERDAKIVITISYGSHAGPHGGLSMIEQALDELLETHVGLQIVLAAGNAGAADCHQRRRLRKDRSALWRVDLVAGDSTDSFIEFWHQAPPEGVSLQWRARSADWQWSDWIGPGEQVLLRNRGDSQPIAMLRHDAQLPGVDGRQMALLAIAPTAARVDDAGPLAPAGRWEIEARLLAKNGGTVGDKVELVVDAWIERDDPGELATAGHQSRFAGCEPGDRRNTLSSIAGVKRAFIVQGHRWIDKQPPDYVSRPGDAKPPFLLSGVCEVDETLPGLRAAAVRSVDSFMMAGTSAAAPVVARQLFNEMLDKPSLDRQGLFERLRDHGKHWRGKPRIRAGFFD